MELSEARDTARRMIERLDSGAPPAPPEPHPRSADVLTLGALLDRYEAMRLREGRWIKMLAKTQRAAAAASQAVPRHYLPTSSQSRPARRSRRMVEAGTVIEANRLLGALGPVLRWAAEEDLIPANFVAGDPSHASEASATAS